MSGEQQGRERNWEEGFRQCYQCLRMTPFGSDGVCLPGPDHGTACALWQAAPSSTPPARDICPPDSDILCASATCARCHPTPARDSEYTWVHLPTEDVDFIAGFEPDRDRTASRADMVRVIEHLQAALLREE